MRVMYYFIEQKIIDIDKELQKTKKQKKKNQYDCDIAYNNLRICKYAKCILQWLSKYKRV